MLTDRSGEQVDLIGYKAFGQPQYADNPAAFEVSNRYTGQIFDSDTGLYYYNARYYDPSIGRFTQPDSMMGDPANPQNFNRYSYVNNNPLNHTDPSGHLNFFVGLSRAIGAAFNSPQGITSSVLSLLGGLGGIALTVCNAGAVYLFGQVFGQSAMETFAPVTGIVLGIIEIVAGCFGDPGLIVSGAFTLASSSASLAGDQTLASDIGWAGIGVSVAVTAYSAYEAATSDSGSSSSSSSSGQGSQNQSSGTQGSTSQPQSLNGATQASPSQGTATQAPAAPAQNTSNPPATDVNCAPDLGSNAPVTLNTNASITNTGNLTNGGTGVDISNSPQAVGLLLALGGTLGIVASYYEAQAGNYAAAGNLFVWGGGTAAIGIATMIANTNVLSPTFPI